MTDNRFDEMKNPLSILFDHYFEAKGSDTPAVEIAYKDFCHSLLDIDPLVAEDIMGAAAVLCMEHERAGFEAGARICGHILRVISE